MSAVLMLLGLISIVCGIGSLVCFIMVLIKMFQNGQTTMGIVCIVTSFLCGIGVLVTFILGWVNVGKWRIQQIMMIWTGCVIASIIIQVITMVVAPAAGGGEFNMQMR